MSFTIGTVAPTLAADAVVQGERRRCIDVADFRGSWVVVAYAAPTLDLLAYAGLEDAFGADGAVVVATTADDYFDAEARIAGSPVRFPVLTDVEETRRITLIVDPRGVVRHVGLRRSPREVLDAFGGLVTAPLAVAA